jgi:predicted TPR repeat methyltransferase
MARMYDMTGQREKALEQYRKVLIITPGDEGAKSRIAELLRRN